VYIGQLDTILFVLIVPVGASLNLVMLKWRSEQIKFLCLVRDCRNISRIFAAPKTCNSLHTLRFRFVLKGRFGRSLSQRPGGMNGLRPLEHWSSGFGSHSRHGRLFAFILRLCCSMCRLRPCDGLIPRVWIKKLKKWPRSTRTVQLLIGR
jgi:hypothetical protein